MKKKIVISLLTLMMATMVFSGCSLVSPKDSSESSDSAASDDATEDSDSEDSESTVDDAEVSDKSYSDSKSTEDFLTLGEYKGLEIACSDDTAIEEGMIANIDYVGKMDGEEFDGGSATGYDLTIGSGTFIDDFEDQLVGHKAGDEVTVKVTFPDDYSQTDYAGKDAEFDVTINSVLKRTASDAFQDVVDASTVTAYAKDLYDDWSSIAKEYYESYAENNDMTYEELLEQSGMTEDDVEDTVKSMVKSQLVALAIMEKEGIATDGDEYNEQLSSLLTTYGVDDKDGLVELGMTESQIDTNIYCNIAYDVLQQYQA